MSVTQIRGLQLRLASLGRDRIDPAFEASLALIESNVASIFNTMSTDAERMAAIDALTSAFQNADVDLQTAITGLVAATKSGAGLEADGSLVLGATNYLTSAASLKAAIQLLDTALKTEEGARIAADAAMQVQVTALAAAGAATAAADLTAVVAAQAIVDAAQNAALSNEVSRATAAEANLQLQADNEVIARNNLNTVLSDAIAAEAIARTNAVNAEASTRASADTTLQSNIDAEALARNTTDSLLSAAIGQEATDRGIALAAEVAARTLVNGGLNDRIQTLESGVATTLTYDKYVNRETPAGIIDGVNASFVLAYTPYANSESVYLNGMLQEPGAGNDYVLTDATLVFSEALVVGDRVKATYFR